ncbi:TMEM175 family protein [Massilia niabensis]|uniref:TMEM175 family protein n=1 Tax=Massilia niabensis TaxID=544910 RepID=A0ABW0L9F9_9BURK
MNKNRLEAFSDGVIAIIITIMVLELRPPESAAVADLATVFPGWLRYLLSYVYVGIYWINHHALLNKFSRVDGGALWANMHLLFWMSLIPYVTAWAGENPMEPVPVALYGFILLMCSISFMLLSWRLHAAEAVSKQAAGYRNKNRLSIGLYALAILVSLSHPPTGSLIHVLLALIWIYPDRREQAGSFL